MTLGECINNYLNDHKMSMRSFATLSGVSHTYISYIINGKTASGAVPVPTIDKYKAFAQAMGMNVNDLIAMVDDKIQWPSSKDRKNSFPGFSITSEDEINLILDYRDASEEIRQAAAGMLRDSAERGRKGESSIPSVG